MFNPDKQQKCVKGIKKPLAQLNNYHCDLVEEKLKKRLGVKHWVNDAWKKEFIACYLILSLFKEIKLSAFFVNKMELYQSKTLSWGWIFFPAEKKTTHRPGKLFNYSGKNGLIPCEERHPVFKKANPEVEFPLNQNRMNEGGISRK